MKFNAIYEDIAQVITNAKKTVVLTGAGMSTESGLQDFRSNNGLWAGKDPMEIASTHTIRPQSFNESDTQYQQRIHAFVDFYVTRIKEVNTHEPNAGHRILADWGRKGYISSIVTQNVDGYHEACGDPEVFPLHGTLLRLRCQQCDTAYGIERYMLTSDERTYFCDQCVTGLIRPNIVLFGEGLDENYVKAEQAAKQADVMLVLGTSLQVMPASYLPMEVVDRGGKLIMINFDDTPLDRYADHIIHGEKIGEVLHKIDSLLS
ncbi:SIR2 family NAD-dependent protein deacylase [Longirhabdus pacifica]|uniref:SIR2 family NAD-dependent protein deacylase n=1 Tax=Longirhabdus pacifica TaxID=2305227 RepID=UPI001F0C5892|nr:NAD-dependent deacylase [Longirhabdus pacifica]